MSQTFELLSFIYHESLRTIIHQLVTLLNWKVTSYRLQEISLFWLVICETMFVLHLPILHSFIRLSCVSYLSVLCHFFHMYWYLQPAAYDSWNFTDNINSFPRNIQNAKIPRRHFRTCEPSNRFKPHQKNHSRILSSIKKDIVALP